MAIAETTLNAVLVREEERLEFMPKLFGRSAMMLAEATIFSWMARLSETYSGGLWNFYRTPDGGGYMAPAYTNPMKISVGTNGYEGEMSPDAAGITACLFAYCHLANSRNSSASRFAELFDQLRDHACGHVEASKILLAID